MPRGMHTAKALRRNESVTSPAPESPKRWAFKNAALGVLMGSAVVLTGVVGMSGQSSPAAAASTPVQTPAPPCPTGYSCVTIPCSTGTCPTIEAGPTSNIGTNPTQYVFIDLYNFPAGDSPAIWLCADVAPITTKAPLCSTAPAPEYAPIFADGSGFITDPVPEVENDGESPISGEVLGNPVEKGTFYCDNGPDLCSLDVFDTDLDGSDTPDTSNTAVVPVTFAASGAGCSKATLVNTESDFGVEGLIASANESGCKGSDPVLAFNTSLDSLSAVDDLTSGGVQIAFTDDPEAPDEQAALKAGGGHYVLIPIAASADVIGFAADMSPTNDDRVLYPHTNFELTPNMVAGLLNTTYDPVTSADLLTGTSCKNPGIAPPKKLDPCPAMESLNSVSGFLPEEDYSTYVRSDNAGVTDELFKWLCAAPDHTVPIGGNPVAETDTAAQILAATDWADSSLDGTCPDTDQFPALGNQVVVNADKNPQNQAKALYTQVSANAVPPRQAGFAVMNWYEALYYGLNSAELQNAAGQFVGPSEASVEAALNDATKNADGTLSFDYTNTTDTAAYPEPAVFYAAVSTDAQPAVQASGEKTILSNLLALTASTSKASLPPGILPLTSTLTTEAQTDIANDIKALPPTKTGGGSPPSKGGTGSSPPPSGAGTGTGPSQTNPGGSSNPGSYTTPTTGTTTTPATTPVSAHTVGTSTNKHTSPTPVSKPTHGGVFHAIQVALAAPEWRWLLGIMLIVGAVAVCGGPLLLTARRLKKRLAVVRKGKE
jgi:hypothetical protein